MIHAELSQGDLLALFTDSVVNPDGKRVPHTRSVFVTRERSASETPAILLVENLAFSLYLATPAGEVDQMQLWEALFTAYASRHYTWRACTALSGEILARTKEMALHYPALERRWLNAEAAGCGDLRAEFLTVERDPGVAERQFPAMLTMLRANQADRIRVETLETNVALYQEYKRLLADLQCVTLVRREMKAPNFFFVKSVVQVPVERRWAIARKLEKSQVWCVSFDNHAVMEYFVGQLRYPLDVGGSKVGVTVLEMDAGGTQATLYDRRRATSVHDYTLRQTPLFVRERLGAVWQFTQHTRQLYYGTLEAGVTRGASVEEGVGRGDPFTTLCAGAQRNPGRLASLTRSVQLGELESAVVLLDYATRGKSAEQSALSALDLLEKMPVERPLSQTTSPEAQPGRKKVCLKRKTEEEGVLGEPITAAKKIKYRGKDAPNMLRQGSLAFFTKENK